MKYSIIIKVFYIHLIFICTLPFSLYAAEGFIHKGNLALPVALQPGPIFSFGQNIVEKYDLLLSETYFYQSGTHQLSQSLTSSLLYGINDNLSVYINIPVSVGLKQDHITSAGLLGVSIQGEYAFYNVAHPTHTDQATIVAALSLPSASAEIPLLDFNVPTFFIGATASRTAIDWYYFGSLGALFIPENSWKDSGHLIFYEMGIGHNIAYASDSWLLTAIFEFNGLAQKGFPTQYQTIIGSNVIYVGPMLFFSAAHANAQIGVQAPLFQNRSGARGENGLRASAEFILFF
jgi:hypothetical protein